MLKKSEKPTAEAAAALELLIRRRRDYIANIKWRSTDNLGELISLQNAIDIVEAAIDDEASRSANPKTSAAQHPARRHTQRDTEQLPPPARVVDRRIRGRPQ